MSARPVLYATSLSISNFRGYGSFVVPLAAKPCVLLLSGPNGLGKTSLFEAVEWALTGTVKRLDSLARGKTDPRDLARRAPGVDAAKVEVAFRDNAGNEERVARTQLIPSAGPPPNAVGTEVSTVAAMLRSDDSRWNVSGSNLADYLHLTHLHPQVASLRFVTFSAKDRWVKVSPLAGAERLERISTGLVKSKGALTKLKDQRGKAAEDAELRRRRWQELLRRLNHLQSLVTTVSDILPPPEVVKLVAAWTARLGFTSPVVVTDDAGVPEASEALRSLRLTLEAARVSDDDRLAVVGRLRPIPSRLALLQSQQSDLHGRAQTLAAHVEQLVSKVQLHEEATAALAAAHESARLALHRAAVRHESLTAALRNIDDLVRFEIELAEAEEQLRAAVRTLEDADVEVRKRREDMAAHERAAQERDHVRSQLAGIDRAGDSIASIEAFEKEIAVEESRRTAANDRLANAHTMAAGLAAEIRARNAALVSAEERVSDFRAKAAVLEQALLTIAGSISEHDADCPVCRTHFAPGQLRQLAQESIRRRDPHLAEVEKAASAIRAELQALKSRESANHLTEREAQAEARSADDNRAQMKLHLEALRSNPLLGGRSGAELRAHLDRTRAQLQAELARLDAQLGRTASAEPSKSALLAAAAAAADSARNAHALAHERSITRQARAQEVRARVEQLRAAYPEANTSRRDLRTLVDQAALAANEARQESDALSVKFADAQASATALRETLVSARNDLAKVQASSSGVENELKTALGQWRAAMLDEHASEAALDREVERLGIRRREIEEGLKAVAGLSHALERWQHAADLHALEAEIRREHGTLDREAYGRNLDAAVENARNGAAAAERARHAAEELSESIQAATADFGERALKPFDGLFRRYLRALVHDERFHDIEAMYEPSARSAALKFVVSVNGSGTEAELILSEGQLGEVSLGAMLAASTAFPWSRWRALLLDDPTQYNDLIHATSLYDVVRNLVRSAGYQVFLSTHDREQADFLRRKLEGFRVPWVECRYVAHGPEGIRAEITSQLEY